MTTTLLLWRCSPCMPPSGTCAAAHPWFVFFLNICAMIHMGMRSKSRIGMLWVAVLPMRAHPQLCSRCSVAIVRQEPRVLATAQSLDTRPDTSAHACGAVLFAGARGLATAQLLDRCWESSLLDTCGESLLGEIFCRVFFLRLFTADDR
jgi:hypothetical protein